MAFRRLKYKYTIEPLHSTDPITALTDYQEDVAFILARYGPGGTNNPPAFTYEFNDTTKEITLTRVDPQWKPPQS